MKPLEFVKILYAAVFLALLMVLGPLFMIGLIIDLF